MRGRGGCQHARGREKRESGEKRGLKQNNTLVGDNLRSCRAKGRSEGRSLWGGQLRRSLGPGLEETRKKRTIQSRDPLSHIPASGPEVAIGGGRCKRPGYEKGRVSHNKITMYLMHCVLTSGNIGVSARHAICCFRSGHEFIQPTSSEPEGTKITKSGRTSASVKLEASTKGNARTRSGGRWLDSGVENHSDLGKLGRVSWSLSLHCQALEECLLVLDKS